jgi:YVTN family beta-propeller protein
VARPALAATSDSIWVLADQKTTLARIDPEANQVVAETRLPAGCTSLIAAESAIWVTCPSEPKLLRVDPNTNLVSNRIEVAEGPISVAAGEGSIWVLSKTAGKVSRIDPKTNKVSATIPLEIPNAQGSMVFGEGSLWISVPGFPISRISPQTEKVIQQFAGEGDGILQTGLASLWLADPVRGRVLRFDPKRIAATLSE